MKSNVVQLPAVMEAQPTAAEIAALMASAKSAGIGLSRMLAVEADRLAAVAREVEGLGDAVPVGVRETARVLAEQAAAASARITAMVR